MDTSTHLFTQDLKSGKFVIFAWDTQQDWQVIRVSSNIEPLFGYSVADFINRKVIYAELIHPDDLARVKREVENAMASGVDEFTHEIYRIKDANGNYRHVYDHTLIVRNQQGEIVEFHGYISDESEIIEHKQRLELVLNGSHLGMWDWYPQSNEVVFDENWAQMLGHELDEIEPNINAWQSRVHPDDLEAAFKDIQDHIEGKTPYFENIHRTRHSNGEWLYILGRGRIAERDVDGQPLRFTGTNTDITQLKKIQADLEQEQKRSLEQSKLLEQTSNRYRSLLELASEAIFVVDTHSGKLLEYSGMTQEYLGYDDMEMKSLTLFDWDKEITLKQYQELCANIDGNIIHLERIHTRKDGSTYEAAIQAKKLVLDQQTVIHATVRDVTEQNRLQRLLNEAQIYNSTIVNNANAIIGVVNLDGTMVRLNQYGQDFVGYSEEQVRSEPYYWSRFLNPNVRDKVQEIINKASVGEIVSSFRNTWLHHSGEERMIEWSNSLLTDSNGTIKGLFTIGIDVQDKYTLEKELRDAHSIVEEAQAVANIGFWELNAHTDELKWDDKTFEIFGADTELDTPSFELFMNFIHPDDRDMVALEYQQSIAEKRHYRVTHRAKDASGNELYLEERGKHEFNDNGVLVRSVGTVQNITDLVKTNQKLELANNIIENAINGVVITDAKSRIIDVNKAFSEISGYSKAELLNKNTKINKSGVHSAAFYQKIYQKLKQTGQWQGKITNRRKDGSHYTCLLNISSINDHKGDILFHAAIYSDITDIQRSQEQLDYLAHHDPLTSLPNRTLFAEELEHALARVSRSENQLAVIFFDIDRFKHINDTFGHNQGDALLVQVANRVKAHARTEDVFARLGGDEFVMLVESLESAEATGFIANKILNAFTDAFVLEDGLSVNVSTSIGIAVCPQDGKNATALLSNADSAMYSAKALGGGQYQYYTPSLTENVKYKLHMESQLRAAIDSNAFHLHYQPQLNLQDNSVCGVEALIRWNSKQDGNVPPDIFIPVAEETGLINRIGEWVIENTFKQAAEWSAKGVEFGYIAINTSVHQFQSGELPKTLAILLEKYQVDASCFELEITEGVLIKHPEHVMKQLNEIRALGFSISIDDFGTGFSSMNYLKKLPVQKLKIDKSFISDIPQDKDDIAITRTIIAMGHNLGLTTIAEGVESLAQFEFLKELKCQQCQGYFFSKPLAAEACMELILSQQQKA